MFITNFTEVSSKVKQNTYTCGEKLGRYLNEKCGIPVLSVNADDEYIFSDNGKLQDVLKNLPFWMKIFK